MDRGASNLDLSSIAKMTMKERLDAWKAQKAEKQRALSFGKSYIFSGTNNEDNEQNWDPNNKTIPRNRSEKSKLESLKSKESNVIGGSQSRRRQSSLGSEKDKEKRAQPRRKSSEVGKKKRISGGSTSSFETSPKVIISPQTITAISDSSVEEPQVDSSKDTEATLKAANAEIARLNEALETAQYQSKAVSKRVEVLEEQMKATWSEIQGQFFLNGVQEQEINALHGSIANSQLDKSEEIREAKKKFKQEKRRLEAENEQLRSMGVELSDQMENLQNMFMTRQTELEEMLDQKQIEIDEMSKLISAMKLREVESKIRLASVEMKVNSMKLRESHANAASREYGLECAVPSLSSEENRRRSSRMSANSSSEEDGEDGDGYDTE